MADFQGTGGADRIDHSGVSPGVITEPGFPAPSAAADLIDAGGGRDTLAGGG